MLVLQLDHVDGAHWWIWSYKEEQTECYLRGFLIQFPCLEDEASVRRDEAVGTLRGRFIKLST